MVLFSHQTHSLALFVARVWPCHQGLVNLVRATCDIILQVLNLVQEVAKPLDLGGMLNTKFAEVSGGASILNCLAQLQLKVRVPCACGLEVAVSARDPAQHCFGIPPCRRDSVGGMRLC